MRFLELNDDDKETKKLRFKRESESWEDIKQVLYYKVFLYIPRVFSSELMSKYNNNLLAGHFGIKKTEELIA